MDIDELDLLARIIEAEAGSQSFEGKMAVGATIDNRRRSEGFGGSSFTEVIMAPGQFSPMNYYTGYAGGEQGVDVMNLNVSDESRNAAAAIYGGEYYDPTGGAVNFLNPDISQPSWLDDMQNTVQIGDHLFGTAGGGGGVAPGDPSLLAGRGRNNEPRLAFNDEQRTRLAEEQQSLRGEEPLSFGNIARSNPMETTPFSFGDYDDEANAAAVRSREPMRTVLFPPTMPNAPAVDTARARLPTTNTAGTSPTQGNTGAKMVRPTDLLTSPVPVNPDTTKKFALVNPDSVREADVNIAMPGVNAGAMQFATMALDPSQYRLSDGDVPATTTDALRAVREPAGGVDPVNPQGRYNLPELRRKEKRRRFAADALEILSVGLGQMASNQPVDLSGVLRTQAERARQYNDAMGGAYGDLLLEGAQPQLRQFLKESGAEHLLPLVDGGSGMRRTALEAAVNHRVSMPERERANAQRERVAMGMAEATGDPSVYSEIMSNEDAYKAASTDYYNLRFGTDDNGKASWTPKLSQELAEDAERLRMPTIAENLRTRGEDYYKAVMPKIVDRDLSRSENQEDLETEEGREAALRSAGVTDESVLDAAKLSKSATERVITDQIDKAGQTAELEPTKELMRQQALPLIRGRPQTDPLVMAFNQAMTGPPTREKLNVLQQELRAAGSDLAGMPTPAQIETMIEEAGIDPQSSIAQGARSGRPDAISRLAEMSADALQRGAEEEPATPFEITNARIADAGADFARNNRATIDIMNNEAVSETMRRAAADELNNALSVRTEATQEAAGEIAGEQQATAVTREDEAARVQERASALRSAIQTSLGGAVDTRALETVTTQEELDSTVDTLLSLYPAEIKEALAGANNETVMQTMLALKTAESGKDTMLDTLLNSNIEQLNEQTANERTEYANRRPMRNAHEDLLERITAPNFDINQGGPLTKALTFAADVLGQAGLDEFANAIVNNDVQAITRIIEANAGEFFGDFRAEGSGQLTEKEGEFFRKAMASAADPYTKAAIISQRLLRMGEANRIATDARSEWMFEKAQAGDTKALATQDGLEEYIRNAVDESGLETIPNVDFTNENFMENYQRDLGTGNIGANTMVRVVDEDGDVVYMPSNALALLIEDMEATTP